MIDPDKFYISLCDWSKDHPDAPDIIKREYTNFMEASEALIDYLYRQFPLATGIDRIEDPDPSGGIEAIQFVPYVQDPEDLDHFVDLDITGHVYWQAPATPL